MPIYLDSANLDHARAVRDLGYVVGITTNPTLIAYEGEPTRARVMKLLDLTPGVVFCQVTAPTLDGRTAQAEEAATIAPGRVVIKIPARTENFALAARLAADGIPVCITAVSSAAQAYLAGQAGAAFVAPYVNRLTRQTGDGLQIVRACRAAVEGAETRILGASLKTPVEAVQTVLAGAHDLTLSFDVLMALGDHELSEVAIADFEAQGAKW